jgi:hypothetical protein
MATLASILYRIAARNLEMIERVEDRLGLPTVKGALRTGRYGQHRIPDDVLSGGRPAVETYVRYVLPNDGLPGRPRGSGTFTDAADFEGAMRAVIGAIREAGKYPSESLVAERMGAPKSGYPACDARQIRKWCSKYRVTWETLTSDE